MADVSVYGVRQTLAELKELDKAVFFEAIKEIKKAARPLAQQLEQNIPSDPPLSGMARGTRYPWSSKARKVEVKYGGRKDRTKDEWPLLKLQLKDAAGAIYDMAGKNKKSQFTAALSARGGGPSRAMWRGEGKTKREAEEAVTEAIARASKLVNAELVKRPQGAK